MNKGRKRRKKHAVHTHAPKPYTVKQENDVVLGQVINWSFILSVPITGVIGYAASWGISLTMLIWGIILLLFAVYNLLGVIFKWDHARACAAYFIRRGYKLDIRGDWNKQDIKDSVLLGAVAGLIGVAFLISAIFH